MKIVIVGSGLVGTTTAYFLSRRGHEVTVIDRAQGPGLETCFANGGLLTPGMAEPWNAPGCWRTLLQSVGRSDSALQLRLFHLPQLLEWGIEFLRNSGAIAFNQNTQANLRLALYSLLVMRSLREQVRLDYSRSARGSLKVFRDRPKWHHAATLADQLTSHGLRFQKLSSEQTAAIEPALAPIAHLLAGSIHYEVDEVGDAHLFCRQLANHAVEHGVDFRFGTEVTSIDMRAGKVLALTSAHERFVAEQFIVAAGSYSTPILKRVGIDLPVRPAKGYSITVDGSQIDPELRIPVVDDELHTVIVPLGSNIRVAGTAEFAGYDRSLDPRRIRNLTSLLQTVLPQLRFDPANASPWSGLRPMSADGVPIIGPTHIPNLFVNTGHGHLGWTMAAGSAHLLADMMSAVAPTIDPSAYALSRFKR